MKKVSLISPCYNGEHYIRPFLESCLNQDYPNVQFIFINDGSTDRTEEIFMSYKSRLEAKDWQVVYIKQENKGQASALNTGLKIFDGDYLIFPDSDDILYPAHITKKVKFMEENPEYAFAFCQIEEVHEENLDEVVGVLKRVSQQNLFDDLINRNNILWPPIGNIFRSDKFLEVVPDRKIYEGKGGQNFQMLLPMAHKFKFGLMKESLGKYVIRRKSHSRLKKTIEQRNAELFDIWINTILSLSDSIRNKTAYINKAYLHFSSSVSASKKFMLFGAFPVIKLKYKNNKTKVYFLGIHLFTIKDSI